MELNTFAQYAIHTNGYHGLFFFFFLTLLILITMQPLMLIVPDIQDVYTPLHTDLIVQVTEVRVALFFFFFSTLSQLYLHSSVNKVL